MEYKYIFDKTDKPLFFIGRENGHNILFYARNKSSYFHAILDRKDMDFVFSGQEIRQILKKLRSKGKLDVYNEVENKYLPYKAYMVSQFPIKGKYIEYDYLSHRTFKQVQRDYFNRDKKWNYQTKRMESREQALFLI